MFFATTAAHDAVGPTTTGDGCVADATVEARIVVFLVVFFTQYWLEIRVNVHRIAAVLVYAWLSERAVGWIVRDIHENSRIFANVFGTLVFLFQDGRVFR